MWYLILGLVFILGPYNDSPTPNALKITYIGSTGFLVEAQGQKVAIDALFGGWCSEDYDIPADSTVALMRSAQPPFDNIDVIAISHWHSDHFDAGIVLQHLIHDPRCVVLCPSQVGDSLAARPEYAEIRSRVRSLHVPIDSVVSCSLGGIIARLLSSHHGAYFDVNLAGKTVDIHRETANFEYLFTVGGGTVFHCGDAAITEKFRYRLLGLGQDSIDVAFVQKWGCHDMPLFQEIVVREEILPRQIFFTHMRPQQGAGWAAGPICASHRRITIAQYPLQTWTVSRAGQ